jgi:DNA-directed RNA polymerase specialized sigma24 family protein
VLGCAPSTVRGYASRALAALRAELGPPVPCAPPVMHIREAHR